MTLDTTTDADVWLTRAELADRWKMPTATLAQWAWRGCGPSYHTFGRHVRYRLSDVIAWENEAAVAQD